MKRARHPAMMLAILAALLVMISRARAEPGRAHGFASSSARGATYYVSPSGDDHNRGLARSAPWRTIQHAAATMAPGDTVLVLAGSYPERVRVTRSGEPGRPISYATETGAGVTMRGFEIEADYIRVSGFEIANHAQAEPAGFGIYLLGSHAVIANNYLHDLCMEGIMLSGGGDRNSERTAYNRVLDNRVVHAEMAGIHVEGRHNLIAGNDISRTAQYPAGCVRRFRADADAFRFFGSGNDFRANYGHDIAWSTPESPDPHIDCFQTWGPASDITIERNLCVWPAASVTINNKAIQIESRDGPSTGITVMNNIFSDMRQGINASGAGTLRVFNNTFDRIMQEGVILAAVSDAQVANNIFFEVGSGRDSYACIDQPSQAGAIMAANDQFLRGTRPGSYCSQAPHLTVDPHFIDAARLDLRLLPDSPLIAAGTPLAAVVDDYYGKPRPQGRRYDLGAIQSQAAAQ